MRNWNRLSKEKRAELFGLEHARGESYGAGGLLPDDCSDCGNCGLPMLGTGLCPRCSFRLDELRREVSNDR